MRKLIGLLVVVLVLVSVFAGCGGDDDGGGDDATDDETSDEASSDEFCDQAEELGIGGAEVDLDDDEALEALEDLADEAPEEVADDFETIAEAAADLQDASDSSDFEDLEEAFDTAFDPEVIEASAGIAEFLGEECGIEVEGAEDLSDFSDLSDLADLSDLDGDVPDSFGSSELRDFWEAEYAGEPFVDAISGISMVTFGTPEVTLTPDALLSEGDALAACDAVLAFADSEGVAEVRVIVQGVPEAGDDEPPVLVTADPGEECEAA